MKQIIQFKNQRKAQSFTSLSTGERREYEITEVRIASWKGDKGTSINGTRHPFQYFLKQL